MKTATSFEDTPITRVSDYWNSRPCNIRHSPKPVGSREYFDEVEARKYFVESHIPAFADFARWKGKRVLEIGCGIGTDTLNFARHGAQVTAVDLTEKSLEVARQRAKVFGLDENIRFIQANAEKLSESVPVEPYDLVYSFGVIHHTPDTAQCLREFQRVLRPGGTACFSVYYKLLPLRWRWLYNLVSWVARGWLVLPGRGRENMLAASSPEELVRLYDGAANPLGKAYTRAEVRRMLPEGLRVLEERRLKYPRRIVPVPIPGAVYRALYNRFGLMLV